MSKHRLIGKHAPVRLRSGWLVAFLSLMAATAGCRGNDHSASEHPATAPHAAASAVVPSAEASAVLAELRAQFDPVRPDPPNGDGRAPLLPPGLADTFDAVSGAVRPHFAIA